MADPGVSGQNFLRLLLGGAQKGVDQIPRQQAQQADLTLALQRMMQQQGQFQQSLDQRADLARAARDQRQEFHDDTQAALARADAKETSRFLQAKTEAGTQKTKDDQADIEAMQQIMKLAEDNPSLRGIFDMLLRVPNTRNQLGAAMGILGSQQAAEAKVAAGKAPMTASESAKMKAGIVKSLISSGSVSPDQAGQVANQIMASISGDPLDASYQQLMLEMNQLVSEIDELRQ